METNFNRYKMSKTRYKFLSPNRIDFVATFDNKKQTIVSMNNQWFKLFGDSDFIYKGEYNTWSFKKDNDFYFVISAPGKGTSIESTIKLGDYFKTGKINKETKEKVQSFIDFLFSKLITSDDTKVNFWKNKIYKIFSNNLAYC